eukprot:15430622-Alexandrium_andersonii.AAC.1
MGHFPILFGIRTLQSSNGRRSFRDGSPPARGGARRPRPSSRTSEPRPTRVMGKMLMLCSQPSGICITSRRPSKKLWLHWPRTVSYTHLTLPTICSV